MTLMYFLINEGNRFEAMIKMKFVKWTSKLKSFFFKIVLSLVVLILTVPSHQVRSIWSMPCLWGRISCFWILTVCILSFTYCRAWFLTSYWLGLSRVTRHLRYIRINSATTVPSWRFSWGSIPILLRWERCQSWVLLGACVNCRKARWIWNWGSIW